MLDKRLVALLTALAILGPASAQQWRKSYEQGLALAKHAEWDAARVKFLEAIQDRPEDRSGPTQIGASITDRRPWRGGAPYSANFGAAYCAFKLAAEAQDMETRGKHMEDAIAGFQKLVNERKASVESLLFLAASYAAHNDPRASRLVQERLTEIDPKQAFRVDQEMIEFRDLRAVRSAEGGTILFPDSTSPIGLVPVLGYKYALLIGNEKGSGQQFAHNDVDLIKESLIEHAGYSEANIVTLKEATTDTMLGAAKALANQLPESAVVFIFFTGAAAHDPATGTDYLMGTDTPGALSFDRMVAKTALFQAFVNRGASVFSFFQVDRERSADGQYFGLEVPKVGRIAQCFANAPGELAYGTVFDQQLHGVYAAAVSQVLVQMRNNRIAVLDFAWATFRKVREGAARGAGGAQTPTLPVISGMTGTARF
ncbi:MAG: caspase family protein [Armatimonadetes bacterium]|nr:caspase family protein [Armatimonadota bacterium]